MQASLKQIETFLRLAAVGNFRRVADMMHTTQPNISSRILHLEHSLGQTLFERSTGGVQLTREGRGLVPHAEYVMKAYAAFLDAGGTQGQSVLRLGVAEMVAHSWLPLFLKEMERRYPNVRLELEVNRSLVLEERILARDLDLAFMNGPIVDLDAVNLDIGTVDFCWVAAPGLVSEIMPVTTLEELSSLTIFTPGEGSKPHIAIVERFSRHEQLRAKIVPSNTIGACLKMAQSGIGVAGLPRYFVEDALRHGSVCEIDTDWTPPPLGFTASYMRSSYDPVISAAAEVGAQLVNWSA
ncbi:LysR family transcriptional regulator [Falsirhodobacter halotolerans]|uniref:LysR family transcriptional regulator n=1 Tax=Falsirhodobacter halotolerans TaxID=1146892 RepID=UPI001FD360A0|nr:LysR family transcriptional regulator [Falsirhodobacter halotolerans]MCJ8138272.1 LysR family transcriptional regulator [Falsirhodobacter halotolerans]